MSHSANIRRIIVFSYLQQYEDHMSTEMCWENSFKKILWLKIIILPFFLPKIRMTFKLRQNAAVIFFINRQNNSNKIISTILSFYPKKKKKKNGVAIYSQLSIAKKR